MNEIITLEDNLTELSEHFGFKLETVKRIYEELLTKECVKRDFDTERVMDCLYAVLQEKSEIIVRINIDEKKRERKKYTSTNDYAINKALFDIYGEESFQDLSDAFLAEYTKARDYLESIDLIEYDLSMANLDNLTPSEGYTI